MCKTDSHTTAGSRSEKILARSIKTKVLVLLPQPADVVYDPALGRVGAGLLTTLGVKTGREHREKERESLFLKCSIHRAQCHTTGMPTLPKCRIEICQKVNCLRIVYNYMEK